MKVKGLRWWIVGLIGVSTVINYIDRSAINIMWPYIYKEFGIADANNKNALALITTFFMIAYAIGQTATGKMMDAIGTRLGMVVSIVGWSISIALHAVARSLLSFNVFRFMLGLSEAGNWPGAAKSNAEWFPAKERGIAQGIFGAGASLGSVVAAPAIAALYLAFGWRTTFVAIAVLGILWVIPWLIINKATPDKHPWLTEGERQHIMASGSSGHEKMQDGITAVPVWEDTNGGSGGITPVPVHGDTNQGSETTVPVREDTNQGDGVTPAAAPVRVSTNRNREAVTSVKAYSWKELLQFRNTWGILLSRFFVDPVWWLFVTWLPTFLKEHFQFDIKQVAAFAWLPYLFAAIGGLLGGYYASLRIRKGATAATARKEAITIGSGLMLLSLVLTAYYLDSLKENVNLAIGLISVTLFGFQFLINNIQTLPSDYFHGKNVGTVAGMGGTTAVLGTLITTWVVPAITETSYVSFFILGAILVPVAWLCIMFITDRKKNHPERARATNAVAAVDA